MYDMTIQLQVNSGRCLYEQIYDYIIQEIRSGKLLAGEKLPSTRSLAEYLQVARTTVDSAYAQLTSEGYIEPRPQKGYFVCEIEDLFQIEAVIDEQGIEKSFAHVLEQENGQNEISIGRRCLYDFSPNGMDLSAFPYGAWRRISKYVLNEGKSDLFMLGESQGDYELRLTISRYLHSSRGVNCIPEQIVIGAGNDYLLMLLEKILGSHLKIAMENPTYKRAYQIFQSLGYQIETVDMDDNGMMVSQLREKDVDVAYVMPSHQYPTGTVMPIGRRTELLRWANEAENRFLIEDDYDSEFRYRGKPIPSLQSSDESGKVIYIGTFSKAIAPAIRVSYMVLPEVLRLRYLSECYFYSCTVSRIDQRILNIFMRDGYFERHLNKMRKKYRSKHEILLENLKPFQTMFEISGEHAGLHLLLKARGGVTEQELLKRAEQQGVKVYGMSDTMVKSMGDRKILYPTILLGFGGLQLDEIREGVAFLEKAWL